LSSFTLKKWDFKDWGATGQREDLVNNANIVLTKSGKLDNIKRTNPHYFVGIQQKIIC